MLLKRHLHAVPGDHGESERYERQNGRFSPQSPVHSSISSEDENHRTHGYENRARRPGSNRSGHRRDESPHRLQIETSNAWRSDYLHRSHSHMRPPNVLPIPSKSRARGQYAPSPTSGYERLSPVPGCSGANSPSGLAKSLSLSPNTSSPPMEDRRRRRVSKHPPSRPSIALLPEAAEFTSSSHQNQRSPIPASPIAHTTSKWTSSVPSPPLSPRLNPDPSMSAGRPMTQQPLVAPEKPSSRSRRNTISKPGTVSSPAMPYATTPQDSFPSQVASVLHMQGGDRSKDGQQRHDYDVQDSRSSLNPPPFLGEILEHVEHSQPSTMAKRKRRESNAAGLFQQVHNTPSNPSVSARSRRTSLSVVRAAETMVSLDY
jgi:hypothetical protein